MIFSFGLLLLLWLGGLPHPAASVEPALAIPAASQPPAPAACVKLVRSDPFQPEESPLPKYPEDAKSAHVEGDVAFHLDVGSGCAPEDISIDDGPEILRKPVEDAVKDWKYCGAPEGQEIHATIAFRLHCPAR